jgi:PBP1b-binding outer membrane lipoprotein LpoB
MKKRRAISFAVLALVLAGCVKNSATIPGAANQFDQQSYLSLVTAKSVIDSAKADLTANSFPASTVAAVKAAVNDAVTAYNAADVSYQAYHAAALAGTATAAQQANVTSAINTLNQKTAAVTAAKGAA